MFTKMKYVSPFTEEVKIGTLQLCQVLGPTTGGGNPNIEGDADGESTFGGK